MADQHTSLADGRYTLQEAIGSGGMATVYRGFDQRLQVTRAVKILNEEFTSKLRIRARFEAEAQMMAVLDHENIVRVYDVGSEGKTVYIVMELVEGQSLLDRIDGDGPIPPLEALQIARDILSGLQQAHAKTVVHRDIKPHNILLSHDGRVRITDFGIARSQHLTEESFTKTGAVMGTWAFMAPEQRVNSKGVDFRADIYGTGATLFAMVTQRTPMDLFAADLDPVMLRDVPPAVLPIIKKATRYQPDERYANTHEMLAAVDRILSQGETLPFTIRTPPPPSDKPPLPEQSRPSSMAGKTYLPEGAGGLLTAGSAESKPVPPPPQVLADTAQPPGALAFDIRADSGTILPEHELNTEEVTEPSRHDTGRVQRQRMVIGLIAILIMIVIGAVGRMVSAPPAPEAEPRPVLPATVEVVPESTPAVIPAATPAEPIGVAPAAPETPAPQDDPEPEPEAEELSPPVEPEPIEEPEPAEATPPPPASLRLLASPPSSAEVGSRAKFSARIPAASIAEHRGYTVRLSYRGIGQGYRVVKMRREGKVWTASIPVTDQQGDGLEWCMFAKPDPSTLPEHSKLTAVPCNRPSRLKVRPN